MINSIEEFQEYVASLNEGEALPTLEICTGSSCVAVGAQQMVASLKTAVKEKELRFHIKPVGCNGLCSQGPFVATRTASQKTMYKKVDTAQAEKFLSGQTEDFEVCSSSDPFFAKQTRIVLENSGEIDPESIEDYLRAGGYRALLKSVHELDAEEILEEIKKSNLRGRGGGGYPTGIKWEAVAKAEGRERYIICNADEGDPGAFMDRSIMESDPHRVLEGMIIAGIACKAERGYIYVRAEYPLAHQRMQKAIKAAQKLGFLGHGILGSSIDFTLEIRLGGGAFVCGEATALIASIEGHRGTPRQKPPHLSHEGLWKSPTVLNNVETFANVAPIIERGAAWFLGIGDEKSSGTKVFALSGQVKNTGLVEIPMGTTLRTIIEEIGGGVIEGKTFKAVQTGGPSGGCIPATLLDLPVTYESLRSIGAMMGSGGMIVMDSSASMVEVAAFFMEFCVDESCGKCTPCRVGTKQLYLLLKRFVEHKATTQDLQTLITLSQTVKEASLCGLGQSAPNPIFSTLEFFKSEYLDCIQEEVSHG